MKCPNCNAESQADARFCSHCGTPLSDATDTTTTFVAIGSDSIPDLSEAEAQAVQDLAPGDALLLVNRGAGDGARFLIDSDITTVGRHPESDIFLDDITVSRHHAKFIREDGRMFLEDLGSLNGTYVNRTLVEGRALLRQGDEIQIGKYRATFSLGEAS